MNTGAGSLRRAVRAPAAWAAASYVAGRLIAVAAATAAWSARDSVPGAWRWQMVDQGALHGGWAGALVDPWVAWDGIWFTLVARQGYVAPESPAFFPAYPYVVRAVDGVTGDLVLAGLLVSLACSAAAMVLLYRMVARRYDERAAAWTVAFFSLCPTSLFLNAVYSESLFLLLVVLSMALAERRLWVGACAVGGLAALTRNTGVLLCVPLVLLYAEGRGWKVRGPHPQWPRDARLGWLALVPAGSLIYMGFLWSRMGDPIAFLTVQRAWARSFALPPVALWRGGRAALHSLGLAASDWPFGPGWLAPAGDGQWMTSMTLLPLVAAIFALVVLALSWRRLPLAYAVWALLVLLVPLSMPMRDAPLYSLPRFLLGAFPLFLGLALLTARRGWLRWSILALSGLALAWLSASFALFSWVA